MQIAMEGLCVVAREDGREIGRAEAAHNPWCFHPDKYDLRLEVDPAHRRRGVGSALLERLIGQLRARDAPPDGQEVLALRANAPEDDAEATGFLTRRGFVEVWRQIPSELELASFDPASFAGAEAPVGVTISTLADARARDPGVLREVYALHALTNRLQLQLDPPTSPPFEEFVAGQVESLVAMPEAWFLARDGGALVGMAYLERVPDNPETVEAGYTAVHPDHRRRGIALLLKLRTIEHARAAGYRAIKTGSNAVNTGMLALNTLLGFLPGPAIVTYEAGPALLHSADAWRRSDR